MVLQASASAAGARRSPLILVAGGIVTTILLAISLVPREGPPGYDYSFVFLVPLLWIPYLLRERLDLSPLHYCLFAAALVLHDLGAYGCYYRYYFGLQFDFYVHYFFGLVAALILARALARRFHPGGVELALLTVLVVTGLGGLHEIMEAASTMFLGENGMYLPQGEPFDTQWDLLNNVLGSLTALFLRKLAARRRANGSAPEPGPR